MLSPYSPAKFLSTPSARRATLRQAFQVQKYYISIHALREEGDLRMLLNSAFTSLFLSTPSARRATVHRMLSSFKIVYFYPRPPRGGRRIIKAQTRTNHIISIHALREEGDLVSVILMP